MKMAYSRAYNLEEFVRILESWGIMDVLLPFLLVFVVIFAVLQKTRILGEGRRRFNAIFSIVLGLMFVIPHVTGVYSSWGFDPVDIMNKALPQVSIVLIAIVMLLILIGVLGGERNWMGGALSGWVAIAAIIAIVAIFGAAAGWWANWRWFESFFGADTIAVIVMILVFAVIIWWVTKGEGSDEKAGALSKFGDAFRDFFKPPK